MCVTCTKNGHVCVGYDDLLDKKDKKKRVELLSPHSSIPNPVAANKAEAKPPSSTDGAAAADVLPLKYKDEWNSARRPPGAYHGIKRKVPYFRYFGPTAIVPGYKQTTVSVRDRRRSRGDDSLHSLAAPDWTWLQALGTPSSGPSHAAFSWNDPPVYDYDGGCKDPVDSRIITLVETFFFQLGPNYPFLRMRRILHAIKQKTLEPILVNSMCALAARFSDLTGPENKFEDLERSEFGHVYAARAHKDTVGTFACPSVAAVQACLLMAYEGFGSNQDSALWMYLGLAIRMAVDLGLGKHVGVIYPGGSDPWYIRGWKRPPTVNQQKEDTDDADDAEDEEALEKERTDTFWAIFILDRVISSGTGRPVTFREDDYELDLPETTAEVVPNLPHPFSCLVRMIYLYGLVSDIFNNVKNTEDLTAEKLSQLGTIENTLISQYLTLDSRLGIDIENFRNYVRAGHGTSYILLHIWFHALVIVLNQPTLLPFGNMSHMAMKSEGKQLAMSSAKSIAGSSCQSCVVQVAMDGPLIVLTQTSSTWPVRCPTCCGPTDLTGRTRERARTHPLLAAVNGRLIMSRQSLSTRKACGAIPSHHNPCTSPPVASSPSIRRIPRYRRYRARETHPRATRQARRCARGRRKRPGSTPFWPILPAQTTRRVTRRCSNCESTGPASTTSWRL